MTIEKITTDSGREVYQVKAETQNPRWYFDADTHAASDKQPPQSTAWLMMSDVERHTPSNDDYLSMTDFVPAVSRQAIAHLPSKPIPEVGPDILGFVLVVVSFLIFIYFLIDWLEKTK